MPDIRLRVGINVPISDVYDAVATRDGVARWWTREIDGESEPGGTLRFRFGRPQPSAVMKVAEITLRHPSSGSASRVPTSGRTPRSPSS